MKGAQMGTTMNWRHELKYPVNAGQVICLQSRIRGLLTPDPHLGGKPFYSVRSIYFDDCRDRCFHENGDGVSPREKFRIRIYDGNPDIIHLELKKKERGMTQKLSCPLTRQQCEDILYGSGPAREEHAPPVWQKFCLDYQNRLLRPKVIVEYDRFPWVYGPGNVRVTFDMRIRSSAALSGFLLPQIPSRPILTAGMHLMEVKYDEFLPDSVYRTLQTENLQISAFSKYYLCRKYNMGGKYGYGFS